MRAERWWQDSSVVDQVFQKSGSFEFVQSTRLLRHHSEAVQQQDWSDNFKFGTSFSLSFPATEIEELSYQDQRIHLTNLVVGLTGTQGALPYTYTNKLKQSTRQQRLEIKEFLGLFNHKLTAKYVDASLTYNLAVRYEIEQDNHYLDILHALNGYVRSQHEQHDLDEYFAEFSGLMQGQNNTAHALKTVLSCVFNEQVQIQEFVKEKFKLGDEQKTSLGGNNPSLLGVNTFCGDTVQQIDGKIEIQIGPLCREQYLAFLPDQPLNKKLKHLIQTWCSPTLFIDVRLILDKREVTPIRLDSGHEIGLGQGAFLMPSAQLEHNSETRYALLGAA
ncbi:type VI secretion protein [Acinetobacter sp. ANC 3929]|uniref:type VI secretion system baseplate subunit TssG n=1 Tax=unclassified Acinetobacter TaxID=196816 RepID=UPI0002D024AC|nr:MULTISPECIES: type VI secretion system baseplate subunit TssG [unclassified Acinetobacter]ENW80535.1 type VI secretion protein [Acinetobacter sp. ANC 3929]MCH7352835.1 type VI secretion system baseplate subunit TssG [Acinetobacter sp. NIPH 2023]MCH7354016.1 type VI secretion system baseplate subunit TssG [Acinetobacter sp. NIPH 1958]MCH7360492.1 type VI secretion system baseplate subunit TssG [Acinetobacter sp. NIPH 2024]